MYAPTSTNSPRSGPTSGDDDGLIDFDGAGEILRAWGNGLRPDPDLTVSEWADRHRMLSGRASAEPGRYRTVRYRPGSAEARPESIRCRSAHSETVRSGSGRSPLP